MPHPKDTPRRRVLDYLRAGGHRKGEILRAGPVEAAAPDVAWALRELRAREPELHSFLVEATRPRSVRRTFRSVGIEAGMSPWGAMRRAERACRRILSYLDTKLSQT